MPRARANTSHQGGQRPLSRSGSAVHRSIGLDTSLVQILNSLASLLVESGYTFNRLMRISRVAYVVAARKMAESSKQRISIARIAASTGLTRTEVSRILKTRTPVIDDHPALSRATRVAEAWKTGSRFCDASGRPRVLRFDGKEPSFSKLVKKFSADIPARAMLTEMKRLRMVVQTSRDEIRLIRTQPSIPKKAVSALDAIHPWVSNLADSILSAKPSDLTSKTDHIKLRFGSLPQVWAAVRSLDEQRHAFLDAISHLGGHSGREDGYRLDVTVATATAKPSRIVISRVKRPRGKRK
jgi:hypothetical protein